MYSVEKCFLGTLYPSQIWRKTEISQDYSSYSHLIQSFKQYGSLYLHTSCSNNSLDLSSWKDKKKDFYYYFIVIIFIIYFIHYIAEAIDSIVISFEIWTKHNKRSDYKHSFVFYQIHRWTTSCKLQDDPRPASRFILWYQPAFFQDSTLRKLMKLTWRSLPKGGSSIHSPFFGWFHHFGVLLKKSIIRLISFISNYETALEPKVWAWSSAHLYTNYSSWEWAFRAVRKPLNSC